MNARRRILGYCRDAAAGEVPPHARYTPLSRVDRRRRFARDQGRAGIRIAGIDPEPTLVGKDSTSRLDVERPFPMVGGRGRRVVVAHVNRPRRLLRKFLAQHAPQLQ
jgi:hypothetical protein